MGSIKGSYDDEQWQPEYSVSQNLIRYVHIKTNAKMFDTPLKTEASRRKGLIDDIKLQASKIPGHISNIELVSQQISSFVIPPEMLDAIRLSIQGAKEIINRAAA